VAMAPHAHAVRRRHTRREIEVVAAAVTRRLQDDPEHVMGTLRLIADPDLLPEPADTKTIELARRVNADRLNARLGEFRAGALSTSEVGKLLGGISRQAVSLRAAGRKLLSHEIGGKRYFPAWQFGTDGPLPGLSRVLAALGDRSPLAADALMRTPLEEEGGRTPAQLLADGEVDRAVHYVSIAGGGL
jgi:hypothetical protein